MRVALLTRAIPSANALVRRIEGVSELALVIVESPRAPEEPKAEAVDLAERATRAAALGADVASRLGARDWFGLVDDARPTLRRLLDRLGSSDEVRAEHARELRAVHQVYGDRAQPIARATPITRIGHRAWASAIPLLERARPDVIAVLGTSLVPEAVTRLARIAAINVHLGLAPHYRGNRCLEHALIADDLENAGVTLHLARPELDAGEIVVQRRVELSAEDDEHVLVHRALDLGHAAFVELLQTLDSGAQLAPTPQPRDVGTYFAVSAYGREHRRLVRALVDGGIVPRFLERRAAGRTRPKPIFDALQVT